MKISDEVMSTLSVLDVIGHEVRIMEQLERKHYLSVNAVLEALGGKWNRKAKAHVFDGDARARLEEALATGTVETAKDVGFFPTPPAIADQLARTAVASMVRVRAGWLSESLEPSTEPPPHGWWLEPSAGDGALINALVGRPGVDGVVAIERDMRRRVVLRDLPHRNLVVMGAVQSVLTGVGELDFADLTIGDVTALLPAGETFRGVLMNPPFCRVGVGDHLDHVRHAWGMLGTGGVLVSVLPISIRFRRDKRHTSFHDFVLRHGQIHDLPEDAFRSSGTDVRTCYVCMVKQ